MAFRPLEKLTENVSPRNFIFMRLLYIQVVQYFNFFFYFYFKQTFHLDKVEEFLETHKRVLCCRSVACIVHM